MLGMIITYYGGEFFKLQVGDTIIGYNPIGKDSKLKSSKFGADIGLVSVNHPDFNGEDSLVYGEKKPFIVHGPGEYEVKDIFIKGFATETTYGGKKMINTVYSVQFENINLCFLGALGSAGALSSELKEKLGTAEILFVPIGGKEVLEPTDAYNKVVVALEPNVVIPMHYDGPKSKELATFLKEGGNGSTEQDKLTIKKKEVVEKEGEITVLTSLTA